MELSIYSKQLDLKYDIEVIKSNNVEKIGQQLLSRFGYPKKIQFSIFDGAQELDLQKAIEEYSLNRSSNLIILFTNKIEITLIHKYFMNWKIIVESWDKFSVIQNRIQMYYGLSQSYEICLKAQKTIYCSDFLLVHEDIHDSVEIQWEAYEYLKYEFEKNQYQIKIEISNDWDTIANQIRERLQIKQFVQIHPKLSNNNQQINPAEQFCKSQFSTQKIFEVIIPQQINIQIKYKEHVQILNVKQEEIVSNLIEKSKQQLKLQNQSIDICYQGKILQMNEKINDLNLHRNSIFELIKQPISLNLQFLNVKTNELIEKVIDIELQLITVLQNIESKNCKNCKDFQVFINQRKIDQNQTIEQLNISNKEIIQYECNAIELNFCIGQKNFNYHAKKSHTLLSLEMEIKNNLQEKIPYNFSIFKLSNLNFTQTLEELGLAYQNVTFKFLPKDRFDCQIIFDNNTIIQTCSPNSTIGDLEKTIANQKGIESFKLQSFYGYLPLKKNEQLKNIYLDEKSAIIMKICQLIEINLMDIDTKEQRIVIINIDDPIKLILDNEGLENILDVYYENEPIDINLNCQQLQIRTNSTLQYKFS
ncbi:unnamed protein product [Paramecium sonneborni]|uniref:Ubiquitin-like domain-containing protein n=1 Tax=Paramecium sonneborni TaxID=65129 RepID=A0A8S1R883_9CILI|nr:unnamed protein product [Paramecium sonneborni]